jgi:thioredoxin 1
LPCYLFLAKTVSMPTEYLNKDDFKKKIFDFEKEQEWNYAGKVPAIIDFFADWCGPCKAIAPVLEELSEEYAGKLMIYKIDTDKEQELSGMFGIQSIPTLLFIPVNGAPMVQQGSVPKSALKKVIEERLLSDVKS